MTTTTAPVAERSLDAALLAAQSEFPEIAKDKTNPHYKTRYASLDAIASGTRPALVKHGLLLNHRVEDTEDGVRVTAVLTHVRSGEVKENSLSCVCPRSNPQSVGSVITYLRRYTVGPLLGVTVDEDDDGNTARPPQTKSRPAMPPPASKPAPPRPSQNISAPPGWPDTPVEQLVEWCATLSTTAAVQFAVELIAKEEALVGQLSEWEPTFEALCAAYKRVTDGFSRDRDRELEAEMKSQLEKIDLAKQADAVFSGDGKETQDDTTSESGACAEA